MLNRITAASFGAVAALVLSTGISRADSPQCADIAAEPLSGSYHDSLELTYDVDLKAGDKITIRIYNTFLTAVDVHVGSFTLFTLYPTWQGDKTDEILLSTYVTSITISLVGEGAVGTYSIDCEPGVPPDSPPEPGATDALPDIQDSAAQQSSSRSIEMITDLVNASIDATYEGNADAASSFMGYAGAVMVVEPTDDRGSSIWAGLKYHWTFGTDQQWTGGQLTGVGGLNFRLDEGWVVGVFGGYEKSGYGLAALDQTLAGAGYSLGLSTAYRVGDWRLELLGYGTRLGYDANAAGTTGSFGASRYVIDGKVTGTLPVAANFDFAPTASLAVVREDHEAYVDSTSAAHGARSYLAARATAGGNLIFYPTSGGFTVTAGAHADYWTTVGQSNSGLTGRAELGSAIDLTGTSTLGLNASLDSIGGKQLGATLDASLKAGF